MIERSPDAWARWYLSRRDSIGAQGYDPVARRGILYGTGCAKCQTGFRVTRALDSVEICGLCGTAWPSKEAFDLKGSFQVSLRPGAAEARLSPYIDVGWIIHGLCHREGESMWACRVYFPWAMGLGGYRRIALEAAENWQSAPFDWNKDKVFRFIPIGRYAFARKLERAELIEDASQWEPKG